MINTDYLHNPGRYGYIRSSEDKNAMLDADSAYYNVDNNRWFEHIGCEYSRGMDVDKEHKEIDHLIMDFVNSSPHLTHKETGYTLDYNSAGDRVVSGHFHLVEYNNCKCREFLFFVRDLSMDEAEEYITAVIDWHYSDRFELNRLAFFPCRGAWTDM